MNHNENEYKNIMKCTIYNKCVHYEVATLRYLVSVLVLADTSQLKYLVFEVSVKSGIGAALLVFLEAANILYSLAVS